MRYSQIEVVISGAVERTGRARLSGGSTVEAALRAAGGLAHRTHAAPAGELVLRRRAPGTRRVSVYRFRIFDVPPESWRSFPLEQNDVLVFSWSLREGGGPIGGV